MSCVWCLTITWAALCLTGSPSPHSKNVCMALTEIIHALPVIPFTIWNSWKIISTLYGTLIKPLSGFFVAPQYKEPFVVQSNLTNVFLDWSGSFSLNGPLGEYSLTENNLRIYSGFHSSLHIPRTSDKSMTTMVLLWPRAGSDLAHRRARLFSVLLVSPLSSSLLSLFTSAFAFQVTCTTDSGSASSPVIKYNTATGIGMFPQAWQVKVIGKSEQCLHSVWAELFLCQYQCCKLIVLTEAPFTILLLPCK